MPFYLKWGGSTCNVSINLSKNIEYIKTLGDKKEHETENMFFFKDLCPFGSTDYVRAIKKWGWHFLLISIYATHVVQIKYVT